MDRNQALVLYRQMLLIRRFEERCAQLYVEGKIGGFLHLVHRPGGGRRRAPSASCGPDDYLITSYRDHGYAPGPRLRPAPRCSPSCAGRPPASAAARAAACTSTTCPRGNFGGDGIVGGHLPVAAGIGYGIRLRGTEQVVPVLLRGRRRATRAPSTRRST